MRLHLSQEETTCQLVVPAATAIVTDIHDSAAERSNLLELITFPLPWAVLRRRAKRDVAAATRLSASYTR